MANIAELAEAEKMVPVQKILKLARLAPDIAEQIARGEEPPGFLLVVEGMRIELTTF